MACESIAESNAFECEDWASSSAAAFVCREEIVNSLLKSGADLSARNKAGLTALDSVQGSFADAKPIYDLIQSVFGPYGLQLDYEAIKQARPKIAEILQSK